MKKLNKILFVVILFFLFSCSKDQLAVNKLEGKWKVIERKSTQNGVSSTTIPNGTFMEFKSCKLEKNQFCDMVFTQPNNPIDLKYKIEDEGKKLINKLPNDNILTEYIINELTSEKLVITRSTGTNSTLQFTLQKED